MIHRQARISRTTHAVQRFFNRFGVFHKDDIGTRRHDITRSGIGQVKDLMDHALFVGQQFLVVFNNVLDLVFGNRLPLVNGLHMKQTSKRIR